MGFNNSDINITVKLVLVGAIKFYLVSQLFYLFPVKKSDSAEDGANLENSFGEGTTRLVSTEDFMNF